MRSLRLTLWFLCAMTLMALGTAVLAEDAPKLSEILPKLAADYEYAPQKGSPGKVGFNHSSHVDAKNPDCTTCHPRLFKMLAKGQTADGQPIRHATMEKGGQCGACHNGKAAFGLKDCETCHSGK